MIKCNFSLYNKHKTVHLNSIFQVFDPEYMHTYMQVHNGFDIGLSMDLTDLAGCNRCSMSWRIRPCRNTSRPRNGLAKNLQKTSKNTVFQLAVFYACNIEINVQTTVILHNKQGYAYRIHPRGPGVPYRKNQKFVWKTVHPVVRALPSGINGSRSARWIHRQKLHLEDSTQFSFKTKNIWNVFGHLPIYTADKMETKAIQDGSWPDTRREPPRVRSKLYLGP